MENNEVMATVVEETSENSLMSFDYDNVLALADRADKMVNALNKIMQAAIKITTAKDWVLIGGKPYLQETGASKVARLFGISWRILPGYPQKEVDDDGYPTFTYRMEFTMGGQKIQTDGMRNSKDSFFGKELDQVDIADVKRSAYTNALNRGIKGILPGLRNIDVRNLEEAGLNTAEISGYTFKEGSNGGKAKNDAKASGLVCSKCGKAVTQQEASYSQSKFGAILCRDCQSAAKKAQTQAPAPVADASFPTDEDMPDFLK